MIPQEYVNYWKTYAPWNFDEYVEQDLLITKVLCAIYADQSLQESLIFRGGTALHKVFLKKPYRYSEDIDFVQISAAPIGPILTALRKTINPFFDKKPKYEIHQGRAVLKYQYEASNPPHPRMKVKIEINTREHFHIDPLQKVELSLLSPWENLQSTLSTYSIEEILATKLRALYQRKKGRDLFDFWVSQSLSPNYKRVVEIFQSYMTHENNQVSYKEFHKNLIEKMERQDFSKDIHPLIPKSLNYDVSEAHKLVDEKILCFLKTK